MYQSDLIVFPWEINFFLAHLFGNYQNYMESVDQIIVDKKNEL